MHVPLVSVFDDWPDDPVLLTSASDDDPCLLTSASDDDPLSY